jgi:hypothetical protein
LNGVTPRSAREIMNRLNEISFNYREPRQKQEELQRIVFLQYGELDVLDGAFVLVVADVRIT